MGLLERFLHEMSLKEARRAGHCKEKLRIAIGIHFYIKVEFKSTK
jgi:hypothetical protein